MYSHSSAHVVRWCWCRWYEELSLIEIGKIYHYHCHHHAYANQIIIKIVFWCGFDWFYVNKIHVYVAFHFHFEYSFSLQSQMTQHSVNTMGKRVRVIRVCVNIIDKTSDERWGWQRTHLMSYNNSFDNSSFDILRHRKTVAHSSRCIWGRRASERTTKKKNTKWIR